MHCYMATNWFKVDYPLLLRYFSFHKFEHQKHLQIVLLASCAICQGERTDKDCILQRDEGVAIILQFHIQTSDLLQEAEPSPINDSFGLSSNLLSSGLVQLEPCVSVPVVCIDGFSILWRWGALRWTTGLHLWTVQLWGERFFLLAQSRPA